MKPSSTDQSPRQRRCELCGGGATVAVAEYDGKTHAQHDYCARCAPGESEELLAQMMTADAAELLEPLGEWEVEARQSASWTAVEEFLSAFQQPGEGARPATEQEMQRIAPRVVRMVSRLKGEMPAVVREFLQRYGPPAG